MPGRQFFGLAFGPDKHLVGTIAAEALGRLAGLTIGWSLLAVVLLPYSGNAPDWFTFDSRKITNGRSVDVVQSAARRSGARGERRG
jgi:hypothetical protein